MHDNASEIVFPRVLGLGGVRNLNAEGRPNLNAEGVG
jgi:hypothetical protein